MTGGDPSEDLKALLEPGEEVRWYETAPRREAYRIAGVVWVVAILGAGLAGLLAGAWFLFVVDATGTAAFVVLASLFVGVAGGALVAATVGASVYVRALAGRIEYAATDRRLVSCGGLLRSSCESILWEDVDHVGLRYRFGVPRELLVYDRFGPPGRRLSASQADLRLRNPPDDHDVFARIQAARADHTGPGLDGSAVEDRVGNRGGSTVEDRGASDLPPAVQAALAPGEAVLYRSDAPVWRRPASTWLRDVTAFTLAGVLALAAAAATWIGYVVLAGGPPPNPVVPLLVCGLVDGTVLWAYLRRRTDERVEPVLTDQRILAHDGEDVLASLSWSEAAGLAVEGSALLVLEEARGIEALPVRAIRGEFKQPWMRIPAGGEAASLYWRLRSVDGESPTTERPPAVAGSPTLD